MSGLFNWDWKDALNGFAVAFLGAALTGILDLLQNGFVMSIEQLKLIGTAGLTAGIAYMIKRYFSNSQGTILTK